MDSVQKGNKDMIGSLGSHGLDVELTTKELELDPWANKMVQEVGSTMRIDGLKYVGTVAIHYYLDEQALLKERYEMANKTQITFKENISESLAAMGFNNAYIALRKHFNENWSHKTTRKSDKR